MVVISPLADVVRGWSEVRRAYVGLFSGRMTITTEFFDYTLHRSGEIFYAVGRERGQTAVGDRTLHQTARATNIFRRGKDGTWKLVHHHVSVAGPKLPTDESTGDQAGSPDR
jgi:ketosteroid isomerase-like protein